MALKRLDTKEKARLCGLIMGVLALLQFSATLKSASEHAKSAVDRRDEATMRALARAIGEDGDCEWSPPARVAPPSPLFKTLVASYPGSGKRLTWLMIEALTNKVVGDDFDLSLHGNHVVALKTSYPHPESMWSWGDKMDQAVMIIRNPRWAIQSYLSMKDELAYSTSWEQSFLRRPYVYTYRAEPPIWEEWRDNNFDIEIKRWGELIDFYFANGVNETTSVPDEHCGTSDLADCVPKEIISFERLYSPPGFGAGAAEMAKLASVLDGTNVELVDESIWDCVFNVTWYHEISRYNNDREGLDPEGSRNFTLPQVQAIQNEMQRVQDKYVADTRPVVQQMLIYIAEYMAEVADEITSLGGR